MKFIIWVSKRYLDFFLKINLKKLLLIQKRSSIATEDLCKTLGPSKLNCNSDFPQQYMHAYVAQSLTLRSIAN